MKIVFARLPVFLLVILPVAFTPGCATPYLWNRTSEFQWKPVPFARVLAVTNTNHECETVVMFKQSAQVGINYFSRDVAWRVSQSPDDLATTSGAIRQLTNSSLGVESVPVYWADKVPTNATALPPGYAVLIHSFTRPPSQVFLNRTNVQLAVYRDGVPSGPYTLPVSPHPKNTTQRVLLTPLAVLADVPFCAFGLFVYVALHL
ncbi:MAG: hypothetical protein ACLPRE_13410 [Limisphaerales bacterium]